MDTVTLMCFINNVLNFMNNKLCYNANILLLFDGFTCRKNKCVSVVSFEAGVCVSLGVCALFIPVNADMVIE